MNNPSQPIEFDKSEVHLIYPFRIHGWRSFYKRTLEFIKSDSRMLESLISELSEDCSSNTIDEYLDTLREESILGGKRSSNSSNDMSVVTDRFLETSVFFRYLKKTLEHDMDENSREHERILWVEDFEVEERGARPYLTKLSPHLVIWLSGEQLKIDNPNALPDLCKILKGDKLKIRSRIKILPSGFGVVRIKVHLMTEEGLGNKVNEISNSSKEPIDDRTTQELERIKEELAKNPKKAERRICDLREGDKIDEETYRKLLKLKEAMTIVDTKLKLDEVIDVQNLDKGYDRGKEPELIFNGGRGQLYSYFKHIVEKRFIMKLERAIQTDLLMQDKQRSNSNEKLEDSLNKLSLDTYWHSKDGEHPYAVTALVVPPGSDESSYQNEISKLLLKVKWEGLRLNWKPFKESLEGLFYSDLLYIAVHQRSTLCIESSPHTIRNNVTTHKSPNTSKYLAELKDTIESQRILWYLYTVYNYMLDEELRIVSGRFDSLMNLVRNERLPEIAKALTEIAKGLEDSKAEICEVMEDPISKKASSLFIEISEAANKAFRLRELYENLNDKLQRLDMLGLHVYEVTHEISSLTVGEATRATQLAVEILEAAIIGIGAAEIAHYSNMGIFHGKDASFPYPWNNWWAYVLIGIGVFSVAMPTIALIRKYRTRFPGDEGRRTEITESIILGIGASILAIIFILSTSSIESLSEYSNPQKALYCIIAALIGVASSVGWLRLNDKAYKRKSEKWEPSD